eukprot:m.74735 g.74735  ORF g.74735 m.74735 type:complete len:101 (-) comp13945_c0_seq4:824-1126(-)
MNTRLSHQNTDEPYWWMMSIYLTAFAATPQRRRCLQKEAFISALACEVEKEASDHYFVLWEIVVQTRKPTTLKPVVTCLVAVFGMCMTRKSEIEFDLWLG